MIKDIYKDKTQPIEKRIEDLLSKMTVEEKVGQMFITGINESEQLLEKVNRGEKVDISTTFTYSTFNPETINKLQKNQVENTRLGIPFLFVSENTHGVYNPSCTVFPTTGLLASTFDKSLAYKFAKASAKEAKALGISQVYAPNIDLSWDARWGRCEENFGEDPYLTGEMGATIVQGFQEQKVAATLKHYIGYCVPESGINLSPNHLGENDLREYFLRPFERCIKAGAWSLMPSYSELDGVPVHASKFWMKDVLRDELKFDGMVITDFGASNMLYSFHRVVPNPLGSAKVLCNNEIDMEGGAAFGYNQDFINLVKEGKFPIEKVDQCVRNILRLKFRTGLFENPYIDLTKIDELVHNQENINLTKEIADKGIVLLKNDNILPLSKDKKVFLTGPLSSNTQLGNYVFYDSLDPSYKGLVTTKEAKTLVEVFEEKQANYASSLGSTHLITNDELLDAAVEEAKKCDVCVICLGDNSKEGSAGDQDSLKKMGSTNATSGEGFDVNNVELPDAQKKLFNRIKELNKPIVLILFGGRPHAITEEKEASNAILYAYGTGEMGSYSLYDILYGNVNPSGKLCISFPRSTGHIPCFYNHKLSARGSFYRRPGSPEKPGRDYVLDKPDALFSFGDGLSYTTFEYSEPVVSKLSSLEYEVKVKVKNTGKLAGDEVVLCFISAVEQELVSPIIKKLRGFERIHLDVNEEKEVIFKLTKEDFDYIGADHLKHIATGKFNLMIGDKAVKFDVE